MFNINLNLFSLIFLKLLKSLGAHLRIYVERLIAHPADDSQETTDDDHHHHEEGKASKRSGGREVALIIKTTCTTMIKKISDGAISFGTRWRHTKLVGLMIDNLVYQTGGFND